MDEDYIRENQLMIGKEHSSFALEYPEKNAEGILQINALWRDKIEEANEIEHLYSYGCRGHERQDLILARKSLERHEQKGIDMQNGEKTETKININWYPGHMTKARRALEEKLKQIDIVAEVLDARAPLYTKNPDFDDLFAPKGRLYLLNKEDMADPAVTKAWVRYFGGQGIIALPFSAVTGNPRQLQAKLEAFGKPFLERAEERGMHKTLRLLVCGIPNVGKSAILNRMIGEKRLKEGNKPGVTRGLSWVRLTPYLELMDSPGMLWPKIEDEKAGAAIALLGSVRQEILDEEQMAFYLVDMLREAEPELLMQRYKLEELAEDPWDVLGQICRRRGFLVRGGEYDYERGAKTLLEEFRNGKLGRFSLQAPPQE